MSSKDKEKEKEKDKVKSKHNGTARQKEIERLEKDVEDLRNLAGDEAADAEFERVSKQVAELRREFYSHLGPWQRAQIARHQNRPYTLDIIGMLFTDFIELHGDRRFADDGAVKLGADDRRMGQSPADRQHAAGMQHRHARSRAGAGGRAVGSTR